MFDIIINVTNLTSNANILATYLLEFWKWLIGGIGLLYLGCGIMLKYLAHITKDITLIHYEDKKSSCIYPKNAIWLSRPFARFFLQMFTSWKKYNKAIKNWEESYDEANKGLSSKVNEIKKYESPTDNETYEFIKSKDDLISAIEKTILNDIKGNLQTTNLRIESFFDGRYELRNENGLIAYSYSLEKLKGIEKSFREIIDDEKIKRLIKKQYTDFQEKNRLENLFKIKLAWRVDIIRLWHFILPYKKEIYPEDIRYGHIQIVEKRSEDKKKEDGNENQF